jgi:hypothetical protein
MAKSQAPKIKTASKPSTPGWTIFDYDSGQRMTPKVYKTVSGAHSGHRAVAQAHPSRAGRFTVQPVGWKRVPAGSPKGGQFTK